MMNFRHGTAPALFVIALACAPPPNLTPVDTDRPDLTDGTTTIAKGVKQIEGGCTYARTGAETDRDCGEMLLRLGAGARSEVRINLGTYARATGGGTTVEGLQDGGIGMKVRVIDAEDSARFGRPAVAIELNTTIPTGSTAYTAGALQPSVVLAPEWSLGDRASIGVNVGYTWAIDADRRFGVANASASLGFNLSDRAGTFLETFAVSPTSRDGPTYGYMDTGVTYRVLQLLQVDARVGAQVYASRGGTPSPAWFTGVGFGERW